MTPEIFCFASNLAGRHGKGSARHARINYGAEYGVGHGRTGNAYAIPTKDEFLKVLPLSVINSCVLVFLLYAYKNPELTFNIVRIGCGLAGYKDEDIAPMFLDAPSNCKLPSEWISIHERIKQEQQAAQINSDTLKSGPNSSSAES